MLRKERTMKILAIGDIVGELAIETLKQVLPQIVKEQKIDFMIVNGENIANARGITKQAFFQLLEIGINVVTMGNHTFSNSEIHEILSHPSLIIPANFNKETIEKGYGIFTCKNQKIFVANLLGKCWGAELNAFDTIDNILNKMKEDIKIKIIDFHGEYVNEKRAMLYFLQNRISVLYGTHTHVQTADEQIISTGVGYITDIGMCGPKESAIGYDIDFEIQRFRGITKEDSKLSRDKQIMINGCIFEIDENTGKTITIKRVNIN